MAATTAAATICTVLPVVGNGGLLAPIIFRSEAYSYYDANDATNQTVLTIAGVIFASETLTLPLTNCIVLGRLDEISVNDMTLLSALGL